MTWDDQISNANKPKVKAKIYDNYHLDQPCPKNKMPLKIKNTG